MTLKLSESDLKSLEQIACDTIDKAFYVKDRLNFVNDAIEYGRAEIEVNRTFGDIKVNAHVVLSVYEVS
jgi:hypothetical protein